MLARYDGMCWVCRTRPALQVEHCHSTGRVRGAACNYCNTGLHYVDELGWLDLARTYLAEEVDIDALEVEAADEVGVCEPQAVGVEVVKAHAEQDVVAGAQASQGRKAQATLTFIDSVGVPLCEAAPVAQVARVDGVPASAEIGHVVGLGRVRVYVQWDGFTYDAARPYHMVATTLREDRTRVAAALLRMA